MQLKLFPHFKPAPWQEVNGSCLQGYIDISYYDLIDMLGEPHNTDGDKTQAEWAIKFNDGTIATIYDWKESRSVKSVRDWHIGGHNSKAVENIQSLFPKSKVTTSQNRIWF